MASEEFFDSIQNQFANNLPFVAYRKPKENEVRALLQNDDSLHALKDFNESGFVFAPFDNKEDAVLIPFSESDFITSNVVIPAKSGIHSISKNESSDAKKNHISLVEKAIKIISSEKLLKVVVSRKEAVELSESNPLEIFKRLLEAFKTAFVYCWYHPKVGLWLGATPETLLKAEGNRFTTMALAGTQPFNESVDIAWGNKEIDEQQLVTDFVVSNLQDTVISLIISDVETVRAGNLLHLRTTLSGALNVEHLNF